MDTDELTEMAYRAIVFAEAFCDFLKCDMGVQARECANEDEYLNVILAFLNDVALDSEEYLESWSLEEDVEVAWFRQRVEAVIDHVTQTLATPIERRVPTSFE